MKNKLQKIRRRVPAGLWRLGLSGVVCVLLFLDLLFVEGVLKKELIDQQAAFRWSDKKDTAQVSCFFADQEVEDRTYFMGVADSITRALVEASLEAPSESARLWIDSVSRMGTVAVTSPQATMELTAVGVTGDFFQFHPLKLKYGSFFSDASMMDDGIVIDEETAWQLFGSGDIAGMQVSIAGVPHYITGVVERQTGRFAEAAGLDKPICYLSMDSLEQYGSVNGGYYYELLLPNPIKGFALTTVQTVVNAQNAEVAVVENQTRYDILPLLEVAGDFGVRSMSKQGIVYPYWENIARGYEDILAVTLLIKLFLLVPPFLFVLLLVLFLWKHKTWTAGSIVRWLKDTLYELQSRKNRKTKEPEEATGEAEAEPELQELSLEELWEETEPEEALEEIEREENEEERKYEETQYH